MTEASNMGATEAPKPEPQAAPSAPKKGMNKIVRNLLLGLGAGIAAVAVVTLIVFTVGIYKFGWQGPTTAALSRAIPYPAVTVNGNAIRYSDYLDDLATVKRFFAKQQERAGSDAAPFQVPPEEEIRRGVMDRLIQTEVLKEEALRYNVTVSKEEIDAEFGNISSDEQGGQVANEILDLYGWSVDTFKERIVRPYLMQTKLAQAIAEDESLTADAKKRADDALARIKGGEEFAAVATELSDDPGSAAEGGDLGWFQRGIMVPEFETAAFALEAGQVSDPVKTQFGYHIIKVEEIEKDKESGEIAKVRARHILIAGPNIDSYLQDKTAAADIKEYIKI